MYIKNYIIAYLHLFTNLNTTNYKKQSAKNTKLSTNISTILSLTTLPNLAFCLSLNKNSPTKRKPRQTTQQETTSFSQYNFIVQMNKNKQDNAYH